MKKLFVLAFFAAMLAGFSQTNSGKTYNDFTRFDLGYERNSFMAHNGWQTNAVAIEFEKSFKTSPFSRNYRVSLGMTDSAQFYLHMPIGPIAGILAAIIAAKSNTSSCGGIGVGALLFILPDGFGFTPLQTEKMHVGIYANFLGVDYVNATGKHGGFDYAPDVGVRTNMYFGKTFFTFVRASAKYSTKFAGWGLQGTAGIGWDFDKN